MIKIIITKTGSIVAISYCFYLIIGMTFKLYYLGNCFLTTTILLFGTDLVGFRGSKIKKEVNSLLLLSVKTESEMILSFFFHT